MVKGKTWFWLIFVLALGICASAWALNKNAPVADKIKWMKSSPFLLKEARTPLPSDLWTSQKTQKLTKIANGTGAISGRVTQAAGGAGIEDVVIAADLLHCYSSYSSAVLSDGNGDYLIEGLPPGNYEISTSNDSVFVDIYWDDKLLWEDADTVPVVSNDTTENIDFSLRAGGKISGTVFLTGSFFQSASIFAYDTTSRYVYTGWAFLTVEAPAPYVVKGLPTGAYKVRTFNGLGFIDVYYSNQSSWADADPVLVTEGNTTSSINFILDSGGVIQGNVSTPGKGFDGVIMAYFATNPEWYSFWYPERGDSYALTGLRPGNWKVLAYGDSTHAYEWYNNHGTWADAATILVSPPDTVSGIDFTLEVGGSISGQVFSSEKGPLSGCEVIAYESSSFYPWGGLTFAFLAKSDSTSNDGTYSIGGLRTGTYYVAASHGCQGMWYNNKPDMQHADPVSVTMPGDTPNIDFNLPSAVEDEADQTSLRLTGFELSQNYPNPFNPGTEIEYTLHRSAQVTLEIFNLLGQKVKTLVNEYQLASSYHIVWEGKNAKGKKVTSGVYFYRLKVNGVSQIKRMVLLK